MPTVLMIDSHPVCLQAGRLIFETAEVEQFLAAQNYIEGDQLYRRHHTDVIVVDLAAADGGVGGLEFIRRIRTYDPHARILVLSMRDDASIVMQSFEAGASGYVLKDSSAEDLLNAVRSLLAGTQFVSAAVANKVAAHRPNQHTMLDSM